MRVEKQRDDHKSKSKDKKTSKSNNIFQEENVSTRNVYRVKKSSDMPGNAFVVVVVVVVVVMVVWIELTKVIIHHSSFTTTTTSNGWISIQVMEVMRMTSPRAGMKRICHTLT